MRVPTPHHGVRSHWLRWACALVSVNMGLAKWAVRAQGEAGMEGSPQRLGWRGRLRVPLVRELTAEGPHVVEQKLPGDPQEVTHGPTRRVLVGKPPVSNHRRRLPNTHSA